MNDLAYLLKSEEYADVDVVIRLAARDEGCHNDAVSPSTARSQTRVSEAALKRIKQTCDNTDLIELSVFPGHRAILCRSDYFRAQVRHRPTPYQAAPK